MDGVIIISGVPGAGKSTIAPLLAGEFERAAHIEADALQHMIVSGGRWPGQEPVDEGYRQLRLRGRHACLLADSFRAAGFVPVIDDIVIGSRIDDFVSDLESRPVHLVLLLPDLETLRRRNRERAKVDAFHESEALDSVAREEHGGRGLRLDTSGHTPAETVKAILAGLADARVA